MPPLADQILVDENLRLCREIRRLHIENAKLMLAVAEIEEATADPDCDRSMIPRIFKMAHAAYESLTQKD